MICVPRDEKNLADVERLVQREIPRIENPLAQGASDEAAKPTDDEKPKKTTRSRSRKPDETKTSTSSAKTDRPQHHEARSEKRDSGKSDNRSRKDSRGGRNNDRGGNKVVGLGDHTPEFIGLSFADRRDS